MLPSTISRVALALVAASPLAAADVRYVDANLSTGNDDGTSWADAFRGSNGLTAALNVAVAGDELWVADGTYKPTTGSSRSATFGMKNSVAVLGGFAGGETHRAQRDAALNVAVLSGDLAGDDGALAFGENSLHVVSFDIGTITEATVLDGFRITGGNANLSGESALGGGVYFEGSTGFLVRCTIEGNRAVEGAALGLAIGTQPTIVDCVVRDNEATAHGGGLSVATTSQAAARFDRCRFTQNRAPRGSAVSLPGQTGNVQFSNCSFDRNVASENTHGAAIRIGPNGYAELRNCTIANNTAPNAPYAGLLVTSGSTTGIVYNSIFSGNVALGSSAQPAQLLGVGLGFAIQSSCVTGQLFAGAGNIDANPVFVDAATGDFRLAAGSPAIDRGNDALTAIPTLGSSLADVAVRARFVDDPLVVASSRVDMGAHERQLTSSTYFCAGERTQGHCPCDASSTMGGLRGCRNAVGAAGLEPDGEASLSADTFVLAATQCTGPAVLFFQGTTRLNGGAGTPFADGLMCAGGVITRLSLKSLSSGGARYPAPGDPTISAVGQVAVAGTTHTYQGWYRSSTPQLCQPVTSNLTNGIEVVWAP